jgi:SAM-dependent methyltransferase
VDWCSRNLPRIRFNANTLSPRLPYENDFMDVIYGISIFTHLSEEMHEQWFRELYRILKTNGIMFLTTQGDNFKVKLTAAELVLYNQGELVVRGNVREGHRTFSAFHPLEFMKKLFGNTLILEHIVTKPLSNAGLPQDVWIVKKL